MNGLIETLPPVREGFNLLESSSAEVFRQLASRELVGGGAYWIDSGNTASTYALGDVSGLKVARAFTAYQHFSILENLEEKVEIGDTVFIPFLTTLYTDSEVSRGEAVNLLESVAGKLEKLQERYRLKILFSMPNCSDPRARSLLLETVDHRIEVDDTRLGERFRTRSFSTRVYPVRRGVFQTTWNFWEPFLREEVKVAGTH